MYGPPKWEPAASGKATGSKMSLELATIDAFDPKENLAKRQAASILRRFPLTPPVARLVTEIAFGRAAA